MTVTRIQIADLLCDAFSPTGASKHELLTTAEANDAPDQVLSQLRTLPTRHFPRMRDLWEHLQDVPVE
jgi:hypothetical protein